MAKKIRQKKAADTAKGAEKEIDQAKQEAALKAAADLKKMKDQQNKLTSAQTAQAREVKLKKLSSKEPMIKDLMDQLVVLTEIAEEYDQLPENQKDAASRIKELAAQVEQQSAEIAELNAEIEKAIKDRDAAQAMLAEVNAIFADQKTS